MKSSGQISSVNLIYKNELGVEFRVSAHQVLVCYFLGVAWGRLPRLPKSFMPDLESYVNTIKQTSDGSLRKAFVDDCGDLHFGHHDSSTLVRIHTPDGLCPCGHCGSELFFVFQNGDGEEILLERVIIFDACYRLSELGMIPQVHEHLRQQLDRDYEHLRYPEHAHHGTSRGDYG